VPEGTKTDVARYCAQGVVVIAGDVACAWNYSDMVTLVRLRTDWETRRGDLGRLFIEVLLALRRARMRDGGRRSHHRP
jgi:hypothetical protein